MASHMGWSFAALAAVGAGLRAVSLEGAARTGTGGGEARAARGPSKSSNRAVTARSVSCFLFLFVNEPWPLPQRGMKHAGSPGHFCTLAHVRSGPSR